MVECPECGAVIDFGEDELEEGDIISCPDCDVNLAVLSTEPLELEVTDEEFDEEEELDDEEDDEEEDEDEENDGFSDDDDDFLESDDIDEEDPK